jgi:hypothetical protein
MPLRVHGKGIVDADPTKTERQFTLRVKVPASLKIKNEEGKLNTVQGTWFLSGWIGEKNPYTGRPVDSILQYLKPGSQVDFEGTLMQIKKDDGTYSTGINLVSLDFATIATKKNENAPPKQVERKPEPEFSDVSVGEPLGMEVLDLGVDMG